MPADRVFGYCYVPRTPSDVRVTFFCNEAALLSLSSLCTFKLIKGGVDSGLFADALTAVEIAILEVHFIFVKNSQRLNSYS